MEGDFKGIIAAASVTPSLLASLYDRAMQYCVAKHGSEPSRILLQSDGSMEAVYDGYEAGDEVYHTIAIECLTDDLQVVYEERKKEEERKRIFEAEQRRIREEKSKAAELERKRQLYLTLKKEFEP